MAAKPIILFNNLIETFGVDNIFTGGEDASFPKENLHDWRLFTQYKSTASGTVQIRVNMGGVLSVAADAFAIANHNAGTTTATLAITSTSSSDYVTGATTHKTINFTSDDPQYFDLDSSSTAQFWQFSFTSVGGAVLEIGLMAVGDKYTMPVLPQSGFDPDRQEGRGTVQTSIGGNLLGASTQNVDRRMQFNMRYLTEAQAQVFKLFYETHGRILKPFFFVPDLTTYATRVYILRWQDNPVLSMPSEGTFRHVSADFSGPLNADFV